MKASVLTQIEIDQLARKLAVYEAIIPELQQEMALFRSRIWRLYLKQMRERKEEEMQIHGGPTD